MSSMLDDTVAIEVSGCPLTDTRWWRTGSPSRGAPPTLADLDDRDFDATLEFVDRRHD